MCPFPEKALTRGALVTIGILSTDDGFCQACLVGSESADE
jgi:hypothetical protein